MFFIKSPRKRIVIIINIDLIFTKSKFKVKFKKSWFYQVQERASLEKLAEILRAGQGCSVLFRGQSSVVWSL